MFWSPSLTLTPNTEFLRFFFPRGQNPPKPWSAAPGIWTPDLLKTCRATPHYTTTLLVLIGCYAWLSILRKAYMYSLGPFFPRKTFTPGGTRIIPCKMPWYLEVLGLSLEFQWNWRKTIIFVSGRLFADINAAIDFPCKSILPFHKFPNVKGYFPNPSRHFSTYLNAFFILIPNIYLKFNNVDIFLKHLMSSVPRLPHGEH